MKGHRGRLRAAVAATLAAGIALAGAQAAGAAAWIGAQQVSATTDSAFLDQSRTIVSLPDGTAVAAWVTRDNGSIGNTRVEAAVGAPRNNFGAPVVLSDTNVEASDPVLAADAGGTVLAVWVESGTVKSSERVAGGAFTPAQTLGATDVLQPTPPRVAIAGGNAVAAWTLGGVTQVAIKPAGTSGFGAPQTFATPTENAKDVDVAITASGAAILTWQTIGPVIDTIRAAARPAGGAFALLTPIFTTAVDLDNVTAPQVEVDAAGRATLLWSYFDSASSIHHVESAARGTTGDFGAPETLSDPTINSGPLGSLDLAVDADNHAVAVWWAGTMQGEVRPAGGAFGNIINNISAPNFVITRPNIVFAPGGRAIANWLSPGGLFYEVQSAILQNGAATFGAPIVAQSVVGAFGERIDGATPIAVDDQGNAITMWRREFDNSPDPGLQPAFRIDTSRLDAVAPAFTSVNIPNTGRVGTPVQVSATATDRLSTPVLTWSFGDGGTATGGTASHTYSRGGTFTVSVTATDAAGNASVASDTIVIPSVPGSGAGAGGGLVPGLDVTGLRLSRKVFRAASRGGSVKPAVAAAKSWTRVTYTVSAAARVRFSFQRPRSGRRVGARCAKPTAGNRSHKSCTRYIAVKGSFSRKRPKGGDRFTFTGRLVGHRLSRGRYRLVATPFDSSGGRGSSGRASFRIR